MKRGLRRAPSARSGSSGIVRAALIAIGAATTLASAGHARAPRASQIALGRAVAERKCAGCHALALSGSSPNRAAPPFRDLYKRYPVDGVREAFLKGYRVAHPPMPKFKLPQGKIDPLLAYLKSLNPCTAPSTDRAAMKRCFEPL